MTLLRCDRSCHRLPRTGVIALLAALLVAVAQDEAEAQQPGPAQPAQSQPEAGQPADEQPAPVEAEQPAPVEAEPAPAAAQPAPAAATAPAAPPVSNLPLGTTFTFGGYIKLDVVYSSASRGIASDVADYILVPGVVPIPANGVDDSLVLSARESRFWLKTSTPTEKYGNIDTHIELDFLGFDANLGGELTTNSSSPRLRHAYGQWRGFLAGQTWSTWMDFVALPDTNDFGSQAGRVFARQAMIRYTHRLSGAGTGPGSEIQLAVENPESSLTIVNPADAATHGTQLITRDELMPDTVAKFVTTGTWGHVTAAGIVRMIRSAGALAAAADETDAQIAFGGRVSGKLMIGPKNNIRFDATAGRGVGRYVALNGIRDGEIDAQGNIELVDVVATLVSGQLWLTETTRINLVGSLAHALENSDDVAAQVNKQLLSVHSNVMWSPAKNLNLGIEYIFVRRTLENDASGDLHRVQGSARYIF